MSSKQENKDSKNAKENATNAQTTPQKKYNTFSFLGGFFLGIIIILIHIGTIATIIIYLNFLIDSKNYNLDKIGFTRLSKNKNFSLCNVFSCVDNWYSSFFANFAIFLVLFFQSIVMSSKLIRQTFVKRALGDLVFYPKYLIRLAGLFNYCMINMLYQPMNFEDLDIYPKINLKDYFHPIFLLIIMLIGFYLICSSLYFNLILNDELGTKLLFKIIKGEKVELVGDYLYGYDIYTSVRDPFRAGIMLLLLGFSPKWDLGRGLYTLFFWFAFYVDGVNDDRFYFEKYDSYKEYIKSVPCRFFNLSFITGKRNRKANENVNNNNNGENEKKENEENNQKKRRNKKKQE